MSLYNRDILKLLISWFLWNIWKIKQLWRPRNYLYEGIIYTKPNNNIETGDCIEVNISVNAEAFSSSWFSSTLLKRKYWNHENVWLPFFDGFAHFGLFWTTLVYFYKMFVYVSSLCVTHLCGYSILRTTIRNVTKFYTLLHFEMKWCWLDFCVYSKIGDTTMHHFQDFYGSYILINAACNFIKHSILLNLDINIC